MSTKRKFSAKLGQPIVKQSAKPLTKVQINDAGTVVSGGADPEEPIINGVKDDIVEISSDPSSDGEEDDSAFDDEDEVTQQTTPSKTMQTQIPAEADEDKYEEMEDAALQSRDTNGNEQVEPSFGDLMLANSSTAIDVAAFSQADPQSSQQRTLAAPSSSSVSLGTVLSQALRTNDIALLESCLSTPEPAIIRATIQRLSSPLASTLLSKLAERLHRRPGRAGSLMVWVQWTLVTHGGYLATQKDLVAQLRELNKVIDERARSLNSLLSLKGKLDMLEAQMQLRRAMRSQREVDEDEDDEAVIYVEDEDEDDNISASSSSPQNTNAKPKPNGIRRSSRSSSLSADMPNGINTELSDHDPASDSEDDSASGSDMIDDEAEETDADDDDEDEVDHEEMDELDEDEESDDGGVGRGPPPAKVARVGGMFSGVR